MDEQQLAGGNNTREVTRVGDTVRRSHGAGGAFAVLVLQYLASVQFPYAPRWLGVDREGRDILSYVPGETTNHPDQRTDGAYCLAGRILRQLHDATAGHPLAAGAECVIHGDPGPFNMICRDGLPVALIDRDSARPGARLDDLAYLAWTWCIQSGNVPIGDQARHLRELRDGYGIIAGDLLSAILGRQDMIAGTEAINRDDPNLSPSRRAHARRAIAWAPPTTTWSSAISGCFERHWPDTARAIRARPHLDENVGGLPRHRRADQRRALVERAA